jgi:hypothetical protein
LRRRVSGLPVLNSNPPASAGGCLVFVSGEFVNGFGDRDGVENGFDHDGILEVNDS